MSTIFVIGGFVEEKYKGNIHKFSHQMDTQEGLSSVTLLYFKNLESFLSHLPAQTTLVLVEILPGAKELKNYIHPKNATYLFGRETKGIENKDIVLIEKFFNGLHCEIPEEYRGKHTKTAYFDKVKITTPQSLNLGVCASIVMYDRQCKENYLF